jgi:SulP family sulfate permease
VVLLVTFFLTVVFDLTIAIEVGMVLAAFLFMRRMAGATAVRVLSEDALDSEVAAGDAPVPDEETPPLPTEGTGMIPTGVQVFEIAGPLFFGAAATFKDAVGRVGKRPSVLIIRMGKVPVIDSTGLHTLSDIVHRSRRDGTLVILCELHEQPALALERSTVKEDVGPENMTETLGGALSLAREHLEAMAALYPRAQRVSKP